MKCLLLFVLVGLAIAQSAPFLTVNSGASCAASLDAVNKLVIVQCGIAPAPLATVLSFNPHALEIPTPGGSVNTATWFWNGVGIMFTKSSAAAPLSFQYGLTGGQTIQQPVSGTIAIPF